ncbi:MAG: DUF3656 domain-containing protein [Lentisphaeria bacterium]|nr:DUF3656 domain-containing protein [Lentisphaeria bacterium]
MKQIPELLAPAGSPACALAAYAAGADAVYAGLAKFNARERGENFDPETMRKVVDFAHRNGKKLYLTLNTLIKEQELPELVQLLETIRSIGPDALLVQDLGTLHIVREYFPSLELHASTQMGFHNSAGFAMAEKLGVTRVVLERQVTLQELADIRKKTALEIEVFIHGALCCSLSGRCLFSSWLGAYSGNRGKCKQPCRRRYFSKNGNGFFFSPQDLCMAEYIPQLKQMGVQSLKIEGRLRQPDYVEAAVGAYRLLLDAPESDFSEALGEARAMLARTCGRKWSTGFATKDSWKELVKADSVGAAGIRCGCVEELRDNGFGFTASKRLSVGDRLRIQPRGGEDGPAVTITRMFANNELVKRAKSGDKVFICCDKDVPADGLVFKIGESFADRKKQLEQLPERKKALDLEIELDAKYLRVVCTNAPVAPFEMPLDLAAAEKHPADAQKVSAAFAEADSDVFALGKCVCRINGAYFLPAAELKAVRRAFWEQVKNSLKPELVMDQDAGVGLMKFRQDYLKLAPAYTLPERLTETVALKPHGAEPASRTALRADNVFTVNKESDEAILPDFCPEDKLPAVAKAIENAYKMGIRRFRVTAVYGLELLKAYKDIFIIASTPLPVCNSLAVKELSRFGVKRVMAHIELEKEAVLALKERSELEVELYRLGRPGLLTTRADLPIEGPFKDNRGNGFEVRRDPRTGLSRIYPQKVLSVPRLEGVFDFYDLVNANWKNSETSTFNFEYPLV